MTAPPTTNVTTSQVEQLVFLKMGGSLITDKTQPETAQLPILERLAAEVGQARKEAPGLRLVLGHGSGSFGHVAARKHDTRAGVHSPEGWLGFSQVAHAAARLNRLVVRIFVEAGVPVWSIQPSAGSWCRDGQLTHWDIRPLEMALERGLVPLVYGDALLDTERGGTIASTEELFAWLAPRLQPARIVLAGTVDGVFSSDPLVDPSAERWPGIAPQDLPRLRAGLGGSHGVDVTGGMLSKVSEMCSLVTAQPGLQVHIISGLRSGAVQATLLNQPNAGGTLITAQQT